MAASHSHPFSPRTPPRLTSFPILLRSRPVSVSLSLNLDRKCVDAACFAAAASLRTRVTGDHRPPWPTPPGWCHPTVSQQAEAGPHMALDEAAATPASAERRGRYRHRRCCHRRRIAGFPRRGAVAGWTSPGVYSSRSFDERDRAWSAEGPQSGLAPAQSTQSGRKTNCHKLEAS